MDKVQKNQITILRTGNQSDHIFTDCTGVQVFNSGKSLVFVSKSGKIVQVYNMPFLVQETD